MVFRLQKLIQNIGSILVAIRWVVKLSLRTFVNYHVCLLLVVEKNKLRDMGKASLTDLAHGKFSGCQRNKIEQFYLAGSKLKLPSKPPFHLQPVLHCLYIIIIRSQGVLHCGCHFWVNTLAVHRHTVLKIHSHPAHSRHLLLNSACAI